MGIKFSDMSAKEKALITYQDLKQLKADKKKAADNILYGYLAENGNSMRKKNKRDNYKYRIKG